VRDRSRYEGRNLLRLLSALGIPILILYFSVTCALTAGRTGQGAAGALSVTARILAFTFYASQLYCAFRVQRALFRPPATVAMTALQYLVVLLVCFIISITGAIACEAFGYNVFLRATSGRAR
jgi:hypothetical protein